MKSPLQSFMISGDDVLGEILRRNAVRVQCERIARKICKYNVARFSDTETVESNLPLPIPHSAIRVPKSK